MQASGYLFVDYESDVDGQVLLGLEFLKEDWVFQVDVIEDWIAQLEILKSKLSNSGDNNDRE